VLLQVGYFVLSSSFNKASADSFSLDATLQAQVDLLKENTLQKDSIKMYPFNPNFISDYKGYMLGMSVVEIDRLHDFRANDKYVNSIEDFQKVTQVSDSLLGNISSFFKFPDWTKKTKQSLISRGKYIDTKSDLSNKKVKYKDLNLATAEDLKSIRGIGDKLSARIVKFRDRLGGFLVGEQLYDVYGLEPEVVDRTLKRFKVTDPPKIKKININTASVETLSKLLYIQKDIAFDIVKLRNSKIKIVSFDELLEIENFPTNKIDRITLYLSL
jgi:DNA uptake protein ComE-like DNA-binding protein